MQRRGWPLLVLALAACGRSPPLVPRPPSVRPTCVLAVEPQALDFGDVAPLGTAERQLTLRDEGDGACLVSAPALAAGSDSGFSLAAAPAQQLLQPGAAATLTVRFAAGPPALPLERLGELTAATTDLELPELHVPLRARLKLCSLAVAPSPLDFGNVILNSALTRTLAVTNVGSAECRVSGLALLAGTSPLFSLPAQPLAFSLAPGAGATVSVSFAARDSAPPHQRTGTLGLDADDLASPRREVPLSAYINTVCTQAGQYIYAVDNSGMFSRFDPATLSWHDIGLLRCPTTSTPFSMNVDQRAVAWVLFDDGNLFRVDTATAACSATSYAPGQAGFQFFGMGSAFDSSTGVDTLYLAGTRSWCSPAPGATSSAPASRRARRCSRPGSSAASQRPPECLELVRDDLVGFEPRGECVDERCDPRVLGRRDGGKPRVREFVVPRGECHRQHVVERGERRLSAVVEGESVVAEVPVVIADGAGELVDQRHGRVRGWREVPRIDEGLDDLRGRHRDVAEPVHRIPEQRRRPTPAKTPEAVVALDDEHAPGAARRLGAKREERSHGRQASRGEGLGALVLGGEQVAPPSTHRRVERRAVLDELRHAVGPRHQELGAFAAQRRRRRRAAFLGKPRRDVDVELTWRDLRARRAVVQRDGNDATAIPAADGDVALPPQQ